MASAFSYLAFGMPGPTEMWVILAIALLLFGTRIPAVMRSLGQGVSEFKRGLSEEPPADSPKEPATSEKAGQPS